MRFKEPHCVLHMLLYGGVCVRHHGQNFGPKDLQKVRRWWCVDYGTTMPLLQPEDRIACCDRITTAGHTGRSIMPRISCGIITSPARHFDASLLMIRVRDGRRRDSHFEQLEMSKHIRHTHRGIIATIESSRISQLVAMMTNRKWNSMRQCADASAIINKPRNLEPLAGQHSGTDTQVSYLKIVEPYTLKQLISPFHFISL